MENSKDINTRILIGQELGEVYLIIQKYINNKWQHKPNNKYRGHYFVKKMLNEILKNDIQSVRKGNKNDMVKLKIADSTSMYINDYSLIKDYPEIKELDKIIKKKIIYKKFSNKLVIVKEKHQQLSENSIFKVILASTLSIGIIGSINNLEIAIENKKVMNEIDSMQKTTIIAVSDILRIQNKTINMINNENIKQEIIHENQMNTVNNLTNTSISNKKINNNIDEIQNANSQIKSQTEIMIENYAQMYYMDVKKVEKIYNENYEEISNSNNPEQKFLILVKEAFYDDNSIDKTPIITTMSSQEKEQCIIDIARNIYKIENEEDLARLLAIHRLEADYGNSRRCVEDNNPGGLRQGASFLTFKTFEIGAESFVRNVEKIVNETYNMSNYDYNTTFENNMQTIYCEGDNDWGIQVGSLKNSILENNELDIYLNKTIEKNNVFVKKKWFFVK